MMRVNIFEETKPKSTTPIFYPIVLAVAFVLIAVFACMALIQPHPECVDNIWKAVLSSLVVFTALSLLSVAVIAFSLSRNLCIVGALAAVGCAFACIGTVSDKTRHMPPSECNTLDGVAYGAAVVGFLYFAWFLNGFSYGWRF